MAFVTHLKRKDDGLRDWATQYSINKSKVLLGFIGSRWEQHIVSELDSALNKWVDAVPDHREPEYYLAVWSANPTDTLDSVRWDPNREDSIFLSQSAGLYAAYYNLQIVVHRPFISSPRKPSSLLFPSLAICTNAARSCIHIMEIHFNKVGRPPFATMVSACTANCRAENRGKLY